VIANMSEVLVLGRKRDALEVVRALQDVGVVQLDPIEPTELPKAVLVGADAERKAKLERLVARAETALAAMNAQNLEPGSLRGVDVEAMLESVGHRADVLNQERTDLAAELGAIGNFGSLARALGELGGTLGKSGRLAVLGFGFADSDDKDKLEKNLKDAGISYSLGHQSVARGNAGVLAVRTQDAATARTALSRAGLAELRFPGRFEGMRYADASSQMDLRSRTAPEELQGITQSLEQLKREHGAQIVAARAELRDELARYDAIGNSVAGKYGFAMRGWVPNANKSQLEAALAPLKGQVVYQFADAPTHHAGHVPVKLENNPVFRPFELLLGMFAPPAYGTFDPTWVLAVFFPLFFGFVIGDVGLGLVSLLVALFFRSKATRGQVLDLGPLGIRVPPKPLMNVATVLTWMSVWSIVFGFLYGEVFGTLGENLGLFHVVKEERVIGGVKVKTPISSLEASPKAKVEGEEKKAYEYEWLEDGKFPGAEHAREYHEERHHGLPIVLPRVKSEFANWMLILSLIPGILQVLFGWLVRARLGMVHHDGKHMWEGIGMFMGLVGVILFAYQYRNPGSSQLFVLGAAACLAVFVFSAIMVMRHNAITGGMMFIEILSNSGNMLSYLRLYAVGLSSAILANLATDMGWNLGGSIGAIPGILIGVIAAILVHTLAIVFTIIGHVLQPLRLHYAEFFTKFGYYEESGRRYQPFARVSQKV
jgi:V/A-type H+/Na+-transporting ATPase subunit I